MKWRRKVERYAASVHPGWFVVAAVVVLAIAAICACSPEELAQGLAGPEESIPDPPSAPAPPGPAPAQVYADSFGNRFTAPWLVTVGVGQRDTFRVRLEGSGDHELVLFQTDTLSARFVPDWAVESRRGLAGSDWTALLADARVLHVEQEHFGAGGFHEWSIPVDGKAAGKADIYFLWQRADGSNRVTGSIEVRVEP